MRARCPTPTLVALALALAPAGGRAAAAPRPEGLVVALSPEVNIFRQKARFAPLAAYLGRKAGVTVRFTILKSYAEVIARVERGQVDGAFFGSFAGAVAIDRLGAIPLVRPVVDGSPHYRGVVFVRRDSGLRGARDLRGKRMAFVDRATTAGYVFPVAWLHEQGVAQVEGFLGERFFAGSHDAAVHAVLERTADVGAAKDSVFNRLAREDPRVARELVVLATSAEVPSNALLVRREVPAPIREALRRALLDAARDPGGAAVLAPLDATAFVETGPGDYESVRAMARRARVPLTLGR